MNKRRFIHYVPVIAQEQILFVFQTLCIHCCVTMKSPFTLSMEMHTRQTDTNELQTKLEGPSQQSRHSNQIDLQAIL